MAAPRREPIVVHITLYSPFLQSKRLMYDRDPGGFLVALVIRRCVNTMEATMETVRLVIWSRFETILLCEIQNHFTVRMRKGGI